MVNIEKRSEPQTAPARTGGNGGSLMSLRREMDRLFDDFMTDLPWAGKRSRWFDWPSREGFGHLLPSLDLSEEGSTYEVSVELPGMDEKNIELTVDDGVLTIKGEKKEEKEEKEKNYVLSERRYGSVHRSISIPDDVDDGKIEAKFDKGVLTVSLAKTAQKKKQSAKKIPIR